MRITVDKDLGIVKIGEKIYYGQESPCSDKNPCKLFALKDLCESLCAYSSICEQLGVEFFLEGPVLVVTKREISSLTKIPEKNIVFLY